jgi:hypothetical protein
MSESDYQRGLRGGDARVSISDSDRWSDWKAGNREYERLQDEEAEANLAALSTPKENIARINKRIAESDVREVADTQAELPRRAAARQAAHDDDIGQLRLGFFLIGAGCLVVGTVAGFILKWILGIPILVTILALFALGAWWLSVSELAPYNEKEEKRAKEEVEDEDWRRRYHPYPAGNRGTWTYCAVTKCWCALPGRCNNHDCTCKVQRVCQTRSCDCTLIKVCPDPACNCGNPKIATNEHCAAITEHA